MQRELRKVASVMSSCFTFSIDSFIRGYRVFKDLCTDPDYDKELECVCELGNLSKPYALSGQMCSYALKEG